MFGATIFWDLDDDQDGNVWHIAANGLTKTEVDSVLLSKHAAKAKSISSGRPMVYGWTETGRHIAVIYELVSRDPLMLYPVTAYEVPPQGGLA